MRFLAVAGLALVFTGCAMGQFQTARTTPKDQWAFTIGQTFVANENNAVRGLAPDNFPSRFEARRGVNERVDVGVSTLLGLGLQIDAKWNLRPPLSPLALALRAGVGGGMQVGGSRVLHVPVELLASYDVTSWFVPYGGVGYGAFWIFGREQPYTDSKDPVVGRTGTGDGLMRFTAGAQFPVNERVALMLEYSYFRPVVDDPGDSFVFVPSHSFGFGLRL